MRSLYPILKILFFISICFMVAALWTAYVSADLLVNGGKTKGEVVQMEQHISEDSDGYSVYTYAPVVVFTVNGNQHKFSGHASSPPAFQKGEIVDVVYNQYKPDKASIRSFGELWLLPIIFGSIGLICGAFPVVTLIMRSRERKLREYLAINGREIQAKISEVKQNRSISVNDNHPWRIHAQWHDSMSNKLYLFKSKNLWYDPSKFTRDLISVSVRFDPKNPKKYQMDLSFLPEVAN